MHQLEKIVPLPIRSTRSEETWLARFECEKQ